MPTFFDIKSGEFVERPDAPKNRARLIEIPEPNTVLSGDGPPDDSIGNHGDFYIDMGSWDIYYREESWGDPTSIVGPAGESIKGDTGAAGPTGERGISGADGISIRNITRVDNAIIITMTDGTDRAFDLPCPADGKDGKDGNDGRGILSISESSPGVALITYTDGGSQSISLPAGRNGREVEMGKSATHIQWRYSGEEKWSDLLRIPKGRAGGGGGASLDDLTNILVAGSNVTLTSTAGGKLSIAASGSGGSIPQSNFSIIC